MTPSIRRYVGTDRDRMLAIFDANTPAFFAVNERADFTRYLDESAGLYAVVECGADLAAGFAVVPGPTGRAHLNWILVDPAMQGGGIGGAMMTAAKERALGLDAVILDIAASQHSAPFFARFGARQLGRIDNGWGPGMHRVDMELSLAG
ncbi:GNAT superfamily N-acetyltransferase [Sphingomonas sp. UYAg733]